MVNLDEDAEADGDNDADGDDDGKEGEDNEDIEQEINSEIKNSINKNLGTGRVIRVLRSPNLRLSPMVVRKQVYTLCSTGMTLHTKKHTMVA